jgi:hypothetical protein
MEELLPVPQIVGVSHNKQASEMEITKNKNPKARL